MLLVDTINPNATGGVRVKLKGIPYRATEQQVMDFLRGYEVIPGSVQFGMEANGKRSGEAFVRCPNLEAAKRIAKERFNAMFDDRSIRVYIE